MNLMFLMSFWSVNRSTSEGVEALQMALHTLRMMALGGIHDHVAQVGTSFKSNLEICFIHLKTNVIILNVLYVTFLY